MRADNLLDIAISISVGLITWWGYNRLFRGTGKKYGLVFSAIFGGIAFVFAKENTEISTSYNESLVLNPNFDQSNNQSVFYSYSREPDAQISKCGTLIYYTSFPAKCHLPKCPVA